MNKTKIQKVIDEFKKDCKYMDLGLIDPYTVGFEAFKGLGFKDADKHALNFTKFIMGIPSN